MEWTEDFLENIKFQSMLVTKIFLPPEGANK